MMTRIADVTTRFFRADVPRRFFIECPECRRVRQIPSGSAASLDNVDFMVCPPCVHFPGDEAASDEWYAHN